MPAVPIRIRSLLVLVLVATASPAAAQGALRAVRVEADNDAFDFWIPPPRPDHDYTHGMRVVADLNGAPGWRRLATGLPSCPPLEERQTCLATRLELGQKIYTPLRDAPAPLPGERPYAGWLYGSATARLVGARRERTLGAEVGVTGPPSLGAAVQTGFHRLAGYWVPQGWGKQLAFEPGVVVRYEDAFLLAEGRSGRARLAVVAPYWGAAAGNVRTDAHAGVRVQLGYGVAHPWSPSREAGAPRAAVYALGGVRGEWVLRDLFLDGSTFRSGPRVEKLPGVGEVEAGAGVRLHRVSLEYRVVTRGREYRTQPRAHRYSTLSLGFRPSR